VTVGQQAAYLPTSKEVEDGAKSVLAIGALVGATWALCRRWYTRRRTAREVRELESRALRYLLDAQRHTLNVIVPHEDRRLIDVDELHRQKLLIDQVRDRLWKADGHSQTLQDIVQVITRTQAIQAKRDRQPDNPFQDGWTEDFDR
jgi:hypothetical protein